MGETEQKRPSAEIKSGGICSSCGESVAEQGKAPGNFCQSCGAKLRKLTQMLTSQGGKVTIGKEGDVFKSVGSEVEPDPAGRHDADAVRAALKGEEGKTEVDWDPEKARVIDVRGLDWVPGKGYVKKQKD